MRVLLNKWQGHEVGFADENRVCDACGKEATVAILDRDFLCAPCLNSALKAIQKSILEEASRG